VKFVQPLRGGGRDRGEGPLFNHMSQLPSAAEFEAIAAIQAPGREVEAVACITASLLCAGQQLGLVTDWKEAQSILSGSDIRDQLANFDCRKLLGATALLQEASRVLHLGETGSTGDEPAAGSPIRAIRRLRSGMDATSWVVQVTLEEARLASRATGLLFEWILDVVAKLGALQAHSDAAALESPFCRLDPDALLCVALKLEPADCAALAATTSTHWEIIAFGSTPWLSFINRLKADMHDDSTSANSAWPQISAPRRICAESRGAARRQYIRLLRAMAARAAEQGV